MTIFSQATSMACTVDFTECSYISCAMSTFQCRHSKPQRYPSWRESSDDIITPAPFTHHEHGDNSIQRTTGPSSAPDACTEHPRAYQPQQRYSRHRRCLPTYLALPVTTTLPVPTSHRQPACSRARAQPDNMRARPSAL